MAQATFLFIIGLLLIAFPQDMLGTLIGKDAPANVRRPTSELRTWVLELDRIDRIDRPGPSVRKLFEDHREVQYPDAGVWSLADPGITRQQWQDMREWLLSAQANNLHEGQLPVAIVEWLSIVDQAPVPSRAMIDSLRDLDGSTEPGQNLKAWILGLDEVKSKSWRQATDLSR